MVRKLKPRGVESLGDLSQAIYDETGVGVNAALAAKQNLLVSGTNIKAVNGYSLLGAGNLVLNATDVGAAPLVHVHAIADVTGLQAALNAKANNVHQHTIGQVTGLQAALDAKSSTSHTHALSALSQSGALVGQVPAWNGATWIPIDVGGGASGGDAFLTALLFG